MCTSSVNALQEFNVHNTRNSDTFHLHLGDLLTACLGTGPLPFCLLPPNSRLESMCKSTLDLYFQSLLDRQTSMTLDELPVVWDSLYETSEDAWITVDRSSQYVTETGLYYGLQPLPAFVSIAASGASKMLLGVSGGTCFQTDAKSGFMEPLVNVRGTNNTFQRVLLNAAGDLGCVMFSNALYVWQHDGFANLSETNHTYKWVTFIEQATALEMLVVSEHTQDFISHCVWTRYRTVNGQFERAAEAKLELASQQSIAWTCVTQSEESTFVAIIEPPYLDYQVYVVNTQQATFALRWPDVPLPNAYVLFPNHSWASVCREDVSNFVVTTTDQSRSTALIVFLSRIHTGAATTAIAGNVRSIVESSDRSMFCFTSSASTVGMFVSQTSNQIVASFQSVSGIQPDGVDWKASICFSGDDRKLWYITSPSIGSQLFANVLSPSNFGTVFQSTFELKLATDLHVSDFGLPQIVLQPKTNWFFGYRIVGPPVQLGATYSSPHEYYRIEIDPSVVASSDEFPHVTTHLQRANVRRLATNGALKLFNNSQTIIADDGDAIRLARNTNDAWGSEESAQEFTQVVYQGSGTKAISPNGLYVYYTPDASRGSGPRVVMNVFNSGAFALFCQSSKEALAKAIQQQSIFCWNQLTNDTASDPSLLFLDKRCTCIAGPALIHTLYPSLGSPDDPTFSKPWNTSLARMNQNFPCISRTCQDAIASPEVTNAYNVTQAKCQDAQLTICASVLQPLSSTLEIRSGIVLQQCNGIIGLQCSQDEQCPLGSVCVNGKCATNCNDNAQCAPGTVCSNGVCVAPGPATQNDPNQDFALISLIVTVSIAFVLLIVLIVLICKRKHA